MTARIIDGKAIAASLRAQVASEVGRLVAEHRLQPGLAVVLVGDDPASSVYVRSKSKQTVEAGMRSFDYRLSANVAQAELLALVRELNADPAVHGILVQLPLPAQIDAQQVLARLIQPRTSTDSSREFGRLAPDLPRCAVHARSAACGLQSVHDRLPARGRGVGAPTSSAALAQPCWRTRR